MRSEEEIRIKFDKLKNKAQEMFDTKGFLRIFDYNYQRTLGEAKALKWVLEQKEAEDGR